MRIDSPCLLPFCSQLCRHSRWRKRRRKGKQRGFMRARCEGEVATSCSRIKMNFDERIKSTCFRISAGSRRSKEAEKYWKNVFATFSLDVRRMVAGRVMQFICPFRLWLRAFWPPVIKFSDLHSWLTNQWASKAQTSRDRATIVKETVLVLVSP